MSIVFQKISKTIAVLLIHHSRHFHAVPTVIRHFQIAEENTVRDSSFSETAADSLNGILQVFTSFSLNRVVKESKHLPHAIHEGEFCIMAGYELFDGSRPAAVETHGGATIEEIVVPIIRITRNTSAWEFKVMNENHKVYFSYKTEPILVIWSKTELSNMMIKINGMSYIGKPEADKKTFNFILPKPDKAIDCLADIYVSSNCVKKGISFQLEREGMQKNNSMGLGVKMGGIGKK